MIFSERRFILNFLYTILFIYVLTIFFRDFLMVLNYLLINNSIPFHSVYSEDSGYLIYLRDVFMILWNVSWTILFIKKSSNIVFLYLVFLFIICIGIILNSQFTLIHLISDFRIINGLLSAYGVFYVSKYFFRKNIIFPIEKILFLILNIMILDAIITCIQFFVVGGNFGFRAMGIFTNSQMNSFMLLFSIVILINLKLSKFLCKKTFIIFFIIISISILFTGTRTSILGVFIIFFILLLNFISKIKPNKVRILIFLVTTLLILFCSFAVIDIVNNIAGRGNFLEQTEGGRISKLFDILYELDKQGLTFLLFGMGTGIGSNLVSGSEYGVVEVFKSVDGTLQYLIARMGLFSLIGIAIVIFLIFSKLKRNYLILYTMIFPVFLISVSVNILEIYSVILIISLLITYNFQKRLIIHDN